MQAGWKQILQMNFTTINALEYTKLIQQLIVVVVLDTRMHMSLSAPLTHKHSQAKWYRVLVFMV